MRVSLPFFDLDGFLKFAAFVFELLELVNQRSLFLLPLFALGSNFLVKTSLLNLSVYRLLNSHQVLFPLLQTADLLLEVFVVLSSLFSSLLKIGILGSVIFEDLLEFLLFIVLLSSLGLVELYLLFDIGLLLF